MSVIKIQEWFYLDEIQHHMVKPHKLNRYPNSLLYALCISKELGSLLMLLASLLYNHVQSSLGPPYYDAGDSSRFP